LNVDANLHCASWRLSADNGAKQERTKVIAWPAAALPKAPDIPVEIRVNGFVQRRQAIISRTCHDHHKVYACASHSRRNIVSIDLQSNPTAHDNGEPQL
jgi:hypothetical protein